MPSPVIGQSALAQSARGPASVGLRWLLPVLFIIGCLLSCPRFKANEPEFVALSGFSLIAGVLLLTRLGAPITITLPVWILLVIFLVGYYFQFFLLALDPAVFPMGQYTIVTDASEALLIQAYATTSLAFLAFCLSAWLTLGPGHGSRRAFLVRSVSPSTTEEHARFVTFLLLVMIPAIELTTAYLSWALNVSVMGADSAVLPHRLAGVLFYTRTAALPTLLILLAWVADHFGFKKRFALAVVLLIIHGVADAILRSSRSSPVFALLGLALLMAVTRRLNRLRFRLIAAGLVLSLLLFPILSAYRFLRADSDLQDIVTPLTGSIAATYGSGHLGDILSNTWFALVFRLTGVDSLLLVMGSGAPPLGVLGVARVSNFFNRDILHLSPQGFNAGAPSLAGWFYLVDGNIGVLVGMISFVLFVQFAWRTLISTNLRSRPVAQTLFLTLLIPAASDGGLESIYWSVLAVALSIGAAELLLIQPHLGHAAASGRPAPPV